MSGLSFPSRKAGAFGLGLLALGPLAGLHAQSAPPDPLDDGPHIYWQSDSRAFVFYRCHGEFQPMEVQARGTVGFRGFCGDSATQYVVSSQKPRVEPDTFDEVSRIFAVSDIHGEYEALVRLLVNARVVDKNLTWSWGSGHLVILGDVFDRGDKVTECLWLVHRLEREAREAGGRVHYLLGNHELMVLQGDLRYVNEKYMDGIVEASGIRYDDLFGPDMEFGRWLRSKHLAVRLNDVLFVHGGVGREVLERKLGIREINAGAREGIDFRTYHFAFNDMPGFLFQGEGPLWYRGYHRATARPQASVEDVRQILEHFDATAVVVGHTDIGELQALYGGLVFGIDVDLGALGSLQGLLWEGGAFYRVNGDGGRERMVGEDPDRGVGS